ncbi:MAG: hypothetical protein E7046_13115 [Lentisphaerae bacterium]|nr:hypothetical protein [Lentisphaerota bacterium]
MKKLIFAAAAVAGMGAFALESANVVGYNGATSGSDNNFVTIPFSDIGYNTADIQSIALSDGGAGSIGWGTETFDIWEGLPTVVAGAGFVYCDPSMDLTGTETTYYWGDAYGNKATYSIAPGQAVVINCAADLEIKTSGEVSDEQVSFTTIADNNFTGNPFPSAIDIQAIKLSDGDAGSIGWGTETFDIWEGLPTVVADAGFVYCDPSMDLTGTETTYYWGDAYGNKATYSIAPGRGVVINCAAGLSITIDAPFSL